VVSKTTSLKIRNDAPLGSTVQNPSGGTILKPAGDADAAPGDGDGASRDGSSQEARGDLALVELQLPDTIRAERSTSVGVAIKNDSTVGVEGVGVTLYVGGKNIEAQQVALKAGETTTLTFKYTPSKPATYTFMAKITRPSGFTDTNTGTIRSHAKPPPSSGRAGQSRCRSEAGPCATPMVLAEAG
jgi:hypothetical protein